MKKILICLVGGLWGLVAFGQQTEIRAKITGSPFETIYLYQFQQTDWFVIDSAKLVNDSFTLSVALSFREMYKLGPDKDGGFLIILGEPIVNVEIDASQTPLTATFQNSPENEHLLEYQKFLANLQLEIKAMNEKLSAAVSNPNHPQQMQARMKTVNDHMISRRQIFYRSMSTRQPATLITKVAKFNLKAPQTPWSGYFKEADFKDPELASVLYYQGKLHSHLNNQAFHAPQEVMAEINRLIDLTDPASPAREALIISAIRLMRGSTENVALLARRYQMEFPEAEIAQQLVDLLPAPGPQLGEEAPEIALQDTSGLNLPLTSLRGKFVLLDFWASWCRPCRVEAPNVVKAFHKYKDRGFTIYSVSLDKNRDKWLQAIEKDRLDWYHVSDLQGWKSEGAAKYGVRSIPTTYLIDPSGKIIGKNLRGARLGETLEQTLNGRPIEK